jgi:hypothetical protein
MYNIREKEIHEDLEVEEKSKDLSCAFVCLFSQKQKRICHSNLYLQLYVKEQQAYCITVIQEAMFLYAC